jgi:serine/threonine protein kinase
MIDLSRHRFDALGHDDECVLCRARREQDGSRVLVLAPAVQYPRPDVLKRLEHEYSLREVLDREWAVRPLALNRAEGQVMLVLEDPSSAATRLDRCLRPAGIRQGGSDAGGQPMELGRFLQLAINLAAGLDKLHRRGLIHKDIKPAHVLVDFETNKVWFTGFGISSRLSRERQAAEPPEVIAGTLAYMAPEQTGRMNRSIDSRSDLYSLGVIFYQMLSGALPFTASDPMDWVHCHVARQPAPPAERQTEVPGVISAVVMKLLAKTAEERYQTAAGLEADLRRALDEWESRGRIDAFPLGARDLPDQLLISECLYGREREIASLHAAFDRVVTAGGPELVLVAGQAGVSLRSTPLRRSVSTIPRSLFWWMKPIA